MNRDVTHEKLVVSHVSRLSLYRLVVHVGSHAFAKSASTDARKIKRSRFDSRGG